ncbi:MAG: outer membrane beta-barrel protein [Pseudomonadota bacterium]|nr:MAG: outer membrane beta-barrel protein [Pseudomonadota bacterium]
MRKSALIVLAMMLISSAAIAQEKGTGQSGWGNLFYGGKAGFMKPDGKGNDSAFNIAGVIGMPLQRYFSWEAELGFSVSDGTVGTNNNWDIFTISGFGVFRTEGRVGVKAKLGLSYWDDPNDNTTSLSAGIGAGIRLGPKGMLDVEYTQINSAVDFISVGYVYNFQ